MIRDAIVALGPWSWVVLGLLLAALELLAPGVFLIWFGLAAIVTGLLDAVFDLSWQTSAIIFALLSVVSVVAGRLATRRRGVHEAEQPFLNRRGAALVGRRSRSKPPSRAAKAGCASTTASGVSWGRIVRQGRG